MMKRMMMNLNFKTALLVAFGAVLCWTAEAAQMSLRQNFVHDVTGLTEQQLAANPAAAIAIGDRVDAAQGTPEELSYAVRHAATNELWSAGFYQPYTLADLTARVEARPNRPGNGQFHFVIGRNVGSLTPEQRAQISTQDLQADPANNDALFQVASNFNALEGASCIPNLMGHVGDLTHYTFARAQGEAATVSAAPGLLLRRYLPSLTIGGFDMNLLLNVPQLPYQNGRLNFQGHNDDQLQALANFDETRCCVGYHGNQDVAFGAWLPDSQSHVKLRPGQQKINQVFTAAVNLAGLQLSPAGRASIEIIAKKLLRVAYQGTIKSAIAFGKRKVFLTLVGGGVFQNPLDWIADAIVATQADVVAHGLDVTVILYDETLYRDQADLASFKRKISQIVAATSGHNEEGYSKTQITCAVCGGVAVVGGCFLAHKAWKARKKKNVRREAALRARRGRGTPDDQAAAAA